MKRECVRGDESLQTGIKERKKETYKASRGEEGIYEARRRGEKEI